MMQRETLKDKLFRELQLRPRKISAAHRRHHIQGQRARVTPARERAPCASRGGRTRTRRPPRHTLVPAVVTPPPPPQVYTVAEGLMEALPEAQLSQLTAKHSSTARRPSSAGRARPASADAQGRRQRGRARRGDDDDATRSLHLGGASAPTSPRPASAGGRRTEQGGRIERGRARRSRRERCGARGGRTRQAIARIDAHVRRRARAVGLRRRQVACAHPRARALAPSVRRSSARSSSSTSRRPERRGSPRTRSSRDLTSRATA